MIDQRSNTRRRSFLRAKVLFPNKAATMDCLVRDISETGARLDIGSQAVIPERFDLHIPQKGVTHRAVIRWRALEEMGVAFEGADPAAPPAATDLATRVQQLESEVARLRRMIEGLLERD
jgi:PilZ domain